MTVPDVVPYDPSWADAFARERADLAARLAGWAVTQVEHIGSTAVPGLAAKPVLDMMVGVRDLGAAAVAARSLRPDWERRPHRSDAVLVVATNDGVERAHLHLTVPGSPLWRERLAFRNALRADADLVEQYGALKQRLLAQSHGRPYTGADKEQFVAGVLARAGIALRADRREV